MIKYLGSKRVLIPRIAAIAGALDGARSALDPFTGTTRVAQALRAGGMRVVAGDTAAYAATFARCYVEVCADELDMVRLQRLLGELDALPGQPGYVTRTFCRDARYFRPENGARIDAIRARIDELELDAAERAVLLTSLVEAADRVDSTTGVQMAYLKRWARRALEPLSLRMPQLVTGPPGRALHGDACDTARAAGSVDLAYVDPPYNQHSYLGNYHVWETLVLGDEPDAYGVARKRVDVRERRSAWNSRRQAAGAFADLLDAVDARWLLLSLNVEGHLAVEAVVAALAQRWGEVAGVPVRHPRYVGARIGIHDPAGRRVGTPGAQHTTEWLLLAGASAADALRAALPQELVAEGAGQIALAPAGVA